MRWYIYDGLGSVVGEVDPSGNVTASQKFDVFGALRGGSGTATTSHGFVGGLGHMSEAGTGLIYMRARYYDPALGRFESEDASQDGGNWFTYAYDSPVNCVDPTGKSGTWTIDLGGGWGIRIDQGQDGEAADLHIWKNDREIGAIWNNGTWKHPTGGPSPLSANETRSLIDRLQANSNKRVRGWSRVFAGGIAVSSVDAYFENNPLDCIAIMLDDAGDDEDAAAVDRLNQEL